MKRIGWVSGICSLLLISAFAVHAQTTDKTLPSFRAFSTTTSKGTYGAGVSIPITVRYSEALAPGSALTVTLNTTPERDVVLSTVSGATISGTYIVASGDTSARLRVTRIKAGTELVRDIAGNTRTDTRASVYADNNNNNNKNNIDERGPFGKGFAYSRIITIDTTAPVAPRTSIVGGTYPTARTIGLSVKGESSTTKIYYTLDGIDPTVTSPQYKSSFVVRTNTTIKAIARDAAGNVGPMLTAAYLIGKQIPTPTPTQTPTQSVPTPTATPTPNITPTPLPGISTKLTCGTADGNPNNQSTLVKSPNIGYEGEEAKLFDVPVGNKVDFQATLTRKDNGQPISNASVEWLAYRANGTRIDENLSTTRTTTDSSGKILNQFMVPQGAVDVGINYYDANHGYYVLCTIHVFSGSPSTITPTPTPTVTPTPTETPTSTYVPNPYDGQTITPLPVNGYDGQTPYISALSVNITSPAESSSFPQGAQIPLAVSGKGPLGCGTWTLTKPNGQTVTLTAADFAEGRLPGDIPSCTSVADPY